MPRIQKKTLADVARPEGRPDYSSYLFTTNPFRLMPVAIEDPSFLTDRDEVFNELKQTVRISLFERITQGRILHGDFGMGKSHILKFLKHLINNELREGAAGRAIAAYASPGKTMLDLYTNIVQDMGEELLVEVSQAVSERHPNIQPQISEGQQYALWSDIGDKPYFVPKYVSVLWEALSSAERRRMYKDHFAALIFLQNGKHRSDALYWLQGGKPPVSDRNAMGISSLITEDTAHEAFVSLVTAIHHAGYDHLYLCLDEMEKLTYLTRRPQSEYFEQFRYVIDQLTEGFSMFGAITSYAWATLEGAQHAFQSRLRQFPLLELPPLGSSQVLELVGDYILRERMSYVETRLGTDEYPYDELRKMVTEEGAPIDIDDEAALELLPFSRDVVEAIGREIRGNPRGILRACARLVDQGYDQRRIYYNPEETLALLG